MVQVRSTHSEKDILNARRCKSIKNVNTELIFEQVPGSEWVTLFLDCMRKPMEFVFEFEGKQVGDEDATRHKYSSAELRPMPTHDVMTIARKWGISGTDKAKLIKDILNAQAEYIAPVAV